MKDSELIKKFRPIFIFSKGEKYYPVNKKFLKDNSRDKKNWKINTESFQKLPFPCEPLYYDIVKKSRDYLIVSYILIFPYTEMGMLNISSIKGDVKSILLYIDKKINSITQIKYEKDIKYFDMKTTRPVIYVERNTHIFSSKINPNKEGLRWEPEKISKFKNSDIIGVKLENKDLISESEYINIKND